LGHEAYRLLILRIKGSETASWKNKKTPVHDLQQKRGVLGGHSTKNLKRRGWRNTTTLFLKWKKTKITRKEEKQGVLTGPRSVRKGGTVQLHWIIQKHKRGGREAKGKSPKRGKKKFEKRAGGVAGAHSGSFVR